MYGAIIGDIIGSPYEFGTGKKTKDFKLFNRMCHLTDDSIMTIAVTEALLSTLNEDNPEIIKNSIVSSMQRWGRLYPGYGYGGRFSQWLNSDNPVPYNSFGNGSAMRVSAAGWLYDSLEKTQFLAKLSAEVTHNHPEGIKGAVAIASSIYLARSGSSKKDIEKYIYDKFDYDIFFKLEQIRPFYKHNESCQGSIPQAIVCFLESVDYEDAIRNAVSIGGDTDTIGAIAGSIAEAYYGIPPKLIRKCNNYLEKPMKLVITEFENHKIPNI